MKEMLDYVIAFDIRKAGSKAVTGADGKRRAFLQLSAVLPSGAISFNTRLKVLGENDSLPDADEVIREEFVYWNRRLEEARVTGNMELSKQAQCMLLLISFISDAKKIAERQYREYRKELEKKASSL